MKVDWGEDRYRIFNALFRAREDREARALESRDRRKYLRGVERDRAEGDIDGRARPFSEFYRRTG